MSKSEQLPCSKCNNEFRFTEDELKSFDKNNKFVCSDCIRKESGKPNEEEMDKVLNNAILTRRERRRREYENRSMFYRFTRSQDGGFNFHLVPLIFFVLVGIAIVITLSVAHNTVVSTAPIYKAEWDYLKNTATCNDFKNISKSILDKKFNENGTYSVQWNAQNVLDYANARILTDCK